MGWWGVGGWGGADAWGRQLFVVHTCSFTGDYKMNGKTNQHQIYLMTVSRQLKSVLKLGQHLSQTKSMHKHTQQTTVTLESFIIYRGIHSRSKTKQLASCPTMAQNVASLRRCSVCWKLSGSLPRSVQTAPRVDMLTPVSPAPCSALALPTCSAALAPHSQTST